MKLEDKIITVTGAGNGVGRAVALEALRRGARVAGVDISAHGLEETAGLAAAGDRFASYVVDITDKAAVSELPARSPSGSAQSTGSSISPRSSSPSSR